VFDEHLFDWKNIDKLTDKMQLTMEQYIKRKAKEEIEEHPSVVKLIQFYNDEFGGEEDSDSETESDSEENSSIASESD
jgi:hypothetical protein